jgi:hypothetical protein
MKPRRKGEATRRGRRRKRGKKGGGFEFVNYAKWLKKWASSKFG